MVLVANLNVTYFKRITDAIKIFVLAILADEQEFSGTKVMEGNCSPGLEMINELKTAQEELREELKSIIFNYFSFINLCFIM
jgi:hypothetical protein